jgi:hypothetical protein
VLPAEPQDLITAMKRTGRRGAPSVAAGDPVVTTPDADE